MMVALPPLEKFDQSYLSIKSSFCDVPGDHGGSADFSKFSSHCYDRLAITQALFCEAFGVRLDGTCHSGEGGALQ